MDASRSKDGAAYPLLSISLLVATVIFGIRVKYPVGVYITLAIVQFIVIGLSAWKLGANAIKLGEEQKRLLAAAGGLLVTSIALFSLLPGIGPPGMQTHEENQLRYLILLIDAIAVTGGFIILASTLSQAGECFYSRLGLGAAIISAPLYLVWASLLLVYYRAAQTMAPGDTPPWVALWSDLSDILLFFGGILIYLATAAFAVSMGRSQWLGKRASRIFASLSLIALLLLVSRGMAFPNLSIAFAHWYTIPGWIVGIPAVPWMMPCLIGIALLRRAGAKLS